MLLVACKLGILIAIHSCALVLMIHDYKPYPLNQMIRCLIVHTLPSVLAQSAIKATHITSQSGADVENPVEQLCLYETIER